MDSRVVDVIASASPDEVLAGLVRSRRVGMQPSTLLSDGTMRLMVYLPPASQARRAPRKARPAPDRHGLDNGPSRIGGVR